MIVLEVICEACITTLPVDSLCARSIYTQMIGPSLHSPRRNWKISTLSQHSEESKTEVLVNRSASQAKSSQDNEHPWREFNQVIKFKHQESVIQEHGCSEMAVDEKLMAVWQKWRKTREVTCDHKLPHKLNINSKVIMIWPVLRHGAETRALKRYGEPLLMQTGMRMINISDR